MPGDSVFSCRIWLLIHAIIMFLSKVAVAQNHFPVVDLHVDLPYQIFFKNRKPDLSSGHTKQSSLANGNYTGVVLPIYLPDYIHNHNPTIQDATDILATITNLIEKNAIFLPLKDVGTDTNRIRTFVSIEGAGAFAKDIPKIDRFIDAGVKLIGPVHMNNNLLASSSTGKPSSIGLSELGKKFCHEVYKKGGLIDVSHMSDKAFEDLVPIANTYHAPIIATHSNARSIFKHARNLTDTQMKTISTSGGVVGINFHSGYVSKEKKPDINDLLKHILHMIQWIGADHVAIGSDFDGCTPVFGLEDTSKLPDLKNKLLQSGVSETDILKIFSINALRILSPSSNP